LGRDPECGRKVLKPIIVPPYYAIEIGPGMAGTTGGPQTNENAQVIDVYDRVIPRLYAAGNASCVVGGFFYPLGGSGISDALSFGRIAGRNVAKEIALG